MGRWMKPRSITVLSRRALVLVCSLTLFFSAAACTSMAMKRANEDSFNLVVENFHNAVRWGEYETAATFVGPTLQEDFWRITDALQNRFSIMDCQVKRTSFDSWRKTGDVTLFVRYYAKNKPELITRTIQEHWRFFEKEKMWYLVSHDFNTLEN